MQKNMKNLSNFINKLFIGCTTKFPFPFLQIEWFRLYFVSPLRDAQIEWFRLYFVSPLRDAHHRQEAV